VRILPFLAAIGCAGRVDVPPPALHLEPAALDVGVSLNIAPPAASLRVLVGDRDVTGSAILALDDPSLGTLAGSTFTPDGHRGGVATITVAAEGQLGSVPVTVRIHCTRFAAGVSASATTWLAPGNDIASTDPLEPGDGAVLPPGLGKLEVDFGADAADDVHEVSLTSPYADVHVFAPGTTGSRHIELTPDEWQVIAATDRGADATLEVRSTKSGGGSPVHVITAHVELADIDPSSLVFGGATVDATGAMTSTPQLYRYDLPHAAVTPYVIEPADGSGCIGCHVAVSRDGAHIAAAGKTSGTGTIVGMIIDTRSRSVTAVGNSPPWNTGVYDPSGRLLTSYTATGELTLRDGATAAVIGTLAIGEPAAGPAISPDGTSLAYVLMATPQANNPVGTALRVRPWNAATGAVGPAITVASAAGVLAPQFSSDGDWILYTRSTEPTERGIVGSTVTRTDGGVSVELSTGATDQIARWASPVQTARVGGRVAEPFAWIVFGSGRALAASPMPGQVRSLWLAAFYPLRAAIGPPFHLPGQSRGLTALHAPYALP
jgi:hypothetical protein